LLARLDLDLSVNERPARLLWLCARKSMSRDQSTMGKGHGKRG